MASNMYRVLFISQQEGEIESNAEREKEPCNSHHKFEFQRILLSRRKNRPGESEVGLWS
jgi:hypothetical protein